jgi:hypothetical protein
MKLYLLGLMADIPNYRLDSVALEARTAECIVAATDSQTARDHMVVAFGKASARAPDGTIYPCAWRDGRVSYCRELAKPAAVEPRSVIRHGVDIAKWYVNQTEYHGILGGYSRMIWWPCAAGERVPPELGR